MQDYASAKIVIEQEEYHQLATSADDILFKAQRGGGLSNGLPLRTSHSPDLSGGIQHRMSGRRSSRLGGQQVALFLFLAFFFPKLSSLDCSSLSFALHALHAGDIQVQTSLKAIV